VPAPATVSHVFGNCESRYRRSWPQLEDIGAASNTNDWPFGNLDSGEQHASVTIPLLVSMTSSHEPLDYLVSWSRAIA
jgi:hypothetical protein